MSSNFARSHAPFVAVAASRGYITTRLDRETFGQRWLITPRGIALIWGFKE